MIRAGLWLVPISLLLVALLDMPYGYYQLLRVLIFCVSAYLAVREKGEHSEGWFWTFAACALIYNPVVKLSLGKEIWPIVNVGTIILFSVHFWLRQVTGRVRGGGGK